MKLTMLTQWIWTEESGWFLSGTMHGSAEARDRHNALLKSDGSERWRDAKFIPVNVEVEVPDEVAVSGYTAR